MKYKGVDISEHQENVNYANVVNSGDVDFVILREGTGTRIDDLFSEHTKNFKTLQVPIIGVYHFVMINDITPEQNAKSVIDNLKQCGYDPKTTWIFCDIEDYTFTSVGFSLDDITRSLCTKLAKRFLDELKKSGCQNLGIYLNRSYYTDYYDWDVLEEYKDKLWLADYSDNPPYVSCIVRQISDDSPVNGFTDTVDTDILYDIDMLNIKGSGKMTVKENALQGMLDLARDNSHGYDQTNRWGPDYDCSSAIFQVWENAGVPVKTDAFKTDGVAYTGNMKSVFLRHNFKDVTKQVNLTTCKGLEPADILLNEKHHVAMYVGNGYEVEASINEKGKATGGQVGDQTGREILVRSYRNYPWNCVLRYVGTESEVEISDGKSDVEISDGTEIIDVDVAGTVEMLRYGDVSESVKTLQFALASLGYTLDIDGDFGRDTLTKVKSFQTSHGLEADGIVGPHTWTVLYSLLTQDVRRLNKVPQYVGIVKASELNVRSFPSSLFSQIMDYPVLGKYNLIDVCASVTNVQGDLWYYVRIAGHIFGFVSAYYIMRK